MLSARHLLFPLVFIACEEATPLPDALVQKQQAVARAPKDPKNLSDLGMHYADAKMLFQAADTLGSAIQEGAKEPRVFARLATVYLALGYHEAARREIKRCHDTDENAPECLYASGRLLEKEGTFEALFQARDVWRKLLQVAPNHDHARYATSALQQLEGQLRGKDRPEPRPEKMPPHEGAGAIPEHANRRGMPNVGELNPYGRAIMLAVQAARQNDMVGAERAFREALKLSPGQPGALAGLADALHSQGRKKDAIAAAQEAHQKSPKDPRVCFVYGLVMSETGHDVKSAVVAWTSLLADHPDYAKAMNIPERLKQIGSSTTSR